jgi:hypothetical protein
LRETLAAVQQESGALFSAEASRPLTAEEAARLRVLGGEAARLWREFQVAGQEFALER